MSKQINIAVVGVSSLVGKAVLTLLEEGKLEFAQVFAVDEDGGGRVSFDNKQLKVEPLDKFDFSKAQLALFCVDEAVAEEYVPVAVEAGCVVVDDSPCFRLEDDVPLVVSEVNGEQLGAHGVPKIVSNPSTCALMLASVLKPLKDAVGVERVNVVTLQAASGKDNDGVEELAKQATAMFNLKPIENKVFPTQLAFNMIPQIGEFLDDGSTREEMKLRWETQKLLVDESLGINATAVRVPVFHGHSMVIHAELAGDCDAETARSLLANAPGIVVIDELEDGEYPTPVVDAIGHDAIFIGRIRKDATHSRGLDLWCVADNIRKGAALNSVQTAEILLKEYL